jgi:hypothetical protein
MSNFLFDVIQFHYGVNVFEDYSKTPLLLRFIYVEFCVLSYELFHYIDVCNEAFELDYNLLIISNFYFVFANIDIS